MEIKLSFEKDIKRKVKEYLKSQVMDRQLIADLIKQYSVNGDYYCGFLTPKEKAYEDTKHKTISEIIDVLGIREEFDKSKRKRTVFPYG